MLHGNCCPKRDVYLQRLDKQIFLTMRVAILDFQSCVYLGYNANMQNTATFPPRKYATETTISAARRKSPSSQVSFLIT